MEQLPLCNHGQHVVGDWQLQSQSDDMPPCCAHDASEIVYNDKHVCPARSAIDAGVRAARNTSEGLQAHDGKLAAVGGHGCSCARSPRHWQDRYAWRPSACRLPAWDAGLFCSRLGTRRVLFLGDSTMRQTFTVVVNRIAFDYIRGKASAATCHDQLFFGQSDSLVKKQGDGGERGHPWQDWVQSMIPDIVIMSAGAHKLTASKFNSTLHLVLDGWTAFPSVHFIWKTQQPGGCGATPGVVSHENAYNHGQFQTFDAMARSILPPTRVLDVSPLYLRPDAHIGSNSTGKKDCLHLCIPGPLSLVPVLLHLQIA